MNRIDTILEKEKSNMDRIFIYVVGDRFMTFGRSAFYVDLLCPQLEVIRGQSDLADSYLCICIPDKWLRWLSEKYNTLADDESIRITLPLNISRQWHYYEVWQQQQLHKH